MRYLKICSTLVLLTCVSSCRHKEESGPLRYGDRTEGDRVRAAQVNLWYQTHRALMKKPDLDIETRLLLDCAIVENYFPLYLQERREGRISDLKFRLARDAYRELKKNKRENLPLFKIDDEKIFSLMVDQGPLTTFGFTEEDLGSLEQFNSLRRQYVKELATE